MKTSSDVITDTPIPTQIAAHRRRAFLLLGAVVGAFFLLGLAIGLLVGVPLVALVGLGAGVAAAAWVYGSAQGMALQHSGARPASPEQYPRYHNVTEGLCVAAGIPKPALYVVTEAGLNACAVGRDPAHAAVVVTTGLLEALDRIELEGLLAQQLSHIRNHDIFPATLAVPLRSLLTPRLLALAVAPNREALADQTGVRLTRYPPGLIAALEKIRKGRRPATTSDRATAHLWLVPADDGGATPLARRIGALRDL